MPRPFRRLFEGPDEIDYAPDPMGRVGAGMQEIHDPTDDPRGNELFQDFREAWAEGQDLPDLFGHDGMLDIKEPVGPAARNRRPDVAKLETFLDALGAHDAARTEGPTGYYGIGFEDNLKAYQARNGLTPDGLVNPDGETIGRIKQDLTETLGPRAMGGDDDADGAGPGARLIPVQSTGRSPLERPSEPSDRDRQARQEFLEASRESERRLRQQQKSEEARRQRQEFLRASRDSERRLKQQEKEAFLEASRESERHLNRELDEIERSARRLLFGAKRLNEAAMVGRIVRPTMPDVRVDNAIGAWERYLDGTGGAVDYDPRWILRHKRLKAAANSIERNYQNWIVGDLKTDDPSRAIADRLLTLRSGQSITVKEPFDGRYKFELPEDRFSDHRLLLGNGFIRATGNFTFSRKGSTIEINGVIENRIRDPFDFTKGRVTRFLPGVEVRHDDMIRLEQHGRAKRFMVRSTWRRRIEGRLRIVPIPGTKSSRLVWIGRPKWTNE